MLKQQPSSILFCGALRSSCALTTRIADRVHPTIKAGGYALIQQAQDNTPRDALLALRLPGSLRPSLEMVSRHVVINALHADRNHSRAVPRGSQAMLPRLEAHYHPAIAQASGYPQYHCPLPLLLRTMLAPALKRSPNTAV